MSSLASSESEAKNPYFYSRKEKSLGVLCSNFLKLYNRDGVDSIGLDEAASRLGVERRRIYDIVNILESVGVLSRKAKNQYTWKGFGAIPRALDELKKEALKENLSTSSCCNSENVSTENEHGGPSKTKIGGQEKPLISCKVDSRKEKSLGLLTQNFIKLFLCSGVDLISLDKAATALLGDIHDPTAMRNNSAAKVRRLYDIANVFSSMNLIEKTQHPESRKPAFRWLGMNGNSDGGATASTALDVNKSKGRVFGTEITNSLSKRATASTALGVNESKRRVFGTEITNTLSKRLKEDSSSDWNSNQKVNMPILIKHNDSIDEHERNSMEQHLKHHSKDFVFGPFTPASVPKVEDSEHRKIKRVQDWENLASSYRPQYRNQALSGAFGHYVEAWKSWHVEVAEKKHIREAL